MKKLLNTPDCYVDDMLDGLVAAHGSLRRTGPEGRVIIRAQRPNQSKVGIASGGGSGHLPLFTGYVGAGLLDSCAIGDVFAGPNLDSCMAAIEAADMGRGVLRLYGNYGGDRMNFDLAGDMLGWDETRLTTVLVNDDVASAAPGERAKRRGVAGLVYAYKTAGACAENGADLAEVTRIARKTVDATRSIGCALSPCQVPGAQSPTFRLDEGDMEMGMGIHGEPGIWRDNLKPADDVADELLERALAETPDGATGHVAILLNTLGATPLEELYILYRRLVQNLAARGLVLRHHLIGHYATSMEMAGVSLSVLHLDDELEALLITPRLPFLDGKTMSTLDLDCARHAAMRARAVFSGPLEQTLNEADGKLGDGDTGVTLRRVFERVDAAAQAEHADLGALFSACGRAAASATGSSLGTLCAMALLHIGKTCTGKHELPWSELSGLLNGTLPVLMQRGQSALGDKTVLDMLDALAQAVAGLDDPASQARSADVAAKKTLQAFRDRPCRIGRARMFSERSIGLDDPGMLALAGLMAAFNTPDVETAARS